MTRYFTVQEANAALPRLRPLVAELVATHGRIVALRPQIQGVLDKSLLESGSPRASEMVLAFARLERTLERIRGMGVEVKDVGTGLCDFPALYQDRDILLCWRHGEARVEWWHELHTGFAGRRHVRELR